jgi:hypothetical protein
MTVVQAFDADAPIREGWMQRERRYREAIETTESNIEQTKHIARQADFLDRKLGLPVHVLDQAYCTHDQICGHVCCLFDFCLLYTVLRHSAVPLRG